MSKQESLADRLKKMKKSVEENKDILQRDFPDDITSTGNPDLIHKEDDQIESNREDSCNDKEAGNKKSKRGKKED